MALEGRKLRLITGCSQPAFRRRRKKADLAICSQSECGFSTRPFHWLPEGFPWSGLAERPSHFLNPNRPDAASAKLTRRNANALSGTMFFWPSFSLPPSPKRAWSKKRLPGFLTAPEEAAIRPGQAGRNGMTARHCLYCSEERYRQRERSPPCTCYDASSFPEGMGSAP
jgi:hypothetical protein